jgi:hypothetical protein
MITQPEGPLRASKLRTPYMPLSHTAALDQINAPLIQLCRSSTITLRRRVDTHWERSARLSSVSKTCAQGCRTSNKSTSRENIEILK